jgi:hypothetical protein
VPFLMIWSVLGRNVPARGRVEVQYVDPAWESSVPAEGIDRFAPPDWSAGARFFERGAADANGSLLEKRWRRHPRLSTLLLVHFLAVEEVKFIPSSSHQQFPSLESCPSPNCPPSAVCVVAYGSITFSCFWRSVCCQPPHRTAPHLQAVVVAD